MLQSKPDPKNFSFDHVADINTTQVICVVHLGRSYCFYQLNLSQSAFCVPKQIIAMLVSQF